MTYTEQLWTKISPVYQAIIEHPFNQELAAGTLARDRFKFYIQQDALYLADFGRALAVMGSRADSPARTLDFLHFAQGAVAVERALHMEYFQLFDIGKPLTRQSPACFAYTNFMLATVAHRSYEEGMAALLPCFWIYREVGLHIHARATTNNPYQAWIDTYAGEDFSRSVDKAIDITEEIASAAATTSKARMEEAFILSSRLEWMFWDSAYRLESWQP